MVQPVVLAFDATEPVAGAPLQLFAEDVALTLLTNETRLSRPNSDGAGWVLGFALLHNTGEVHRQIGPPAAMLPIANARNETSEVAVFGQASIPINERLTATLGGRLSIARSDGQVLDADESSLGAATTAEQITFVGRGWTVGIAHEAALKVIDTTAALAGLRSRNPASMRPDALLR